MCTGGAGKKSVPISSVLRTISIIIIDTGVRALLEHCLKRVLDLNVT
jgi:hypothetical protein